MKPMNSTARIGILCSALIAAACTAQADVAQADVKPSPPGKTAAGASTADTRAKVVLDQQVKALPSDHAAFMATFAKGAVVMLPRLSVLLDPSLEIGGQITGLTPHAAMKSVKVKKLVTGGDAAGAWLAAELEMVMLESEPGEKPATTTRTVRAVELLDAASDWRVVAASFTDGRTIERSKQSLGAIPSPTAVGPLVKLLAAPDALAAALATDPAVVYGTDPTERAFGAAAGKSLLAKWAKLPLAVEEKDLAREVHGKAWGFAMADVNLAKPGGPPYRMSGFVVAAANPDGSWQPVAVSYGAL